jgi:methionyl-tRNA synthetase
VSKFYITTPIYYVNDEPHIGHAYSTILADVLSRYHRLFGDEVFFSTGTDEHGLKVQEAAKKRGVEPKKHCDEMVLRFLELWKKLGISYTKFIRTTDRRHKFVVQNLLTYLYERGDIYYDTYVGKYCIPEERFWTEKDLVGGKCPSCGRDVITIEEKNYFFKLSKYRDWLVAYIKEHPDFIKPVSRRNEILGFLKKELNDLCISRPKSRLDWGIEIPFDKKYVTYVWFDALINYISTVGVYRNNDSFQKWWPATIHLVGKDIITTHAVYWPIMLKSAGFELPQTIFAHGWWLIQDSKMSKSLGNVVRPIDLIDKYGPSSFRYVLIKNMTLGADANFSEEIVIDTINSDLANDYGNLLSRLVQMVQRYYDGVVPEPGTVSRSERDIMETGNRLAPKMKEAIQSMELNKALDYVLLYIRKINKYIDETAPWSLHRKGDTEKLATVLYTACEAFRLANTFLAPVIPDKAQEAHLVFGDEILKQTDNVNTSQGLLQWGGLKPGTKLAPTGSLFPRIEYKKEAKKNRMDKKMKKEESVDISHFQKFDFRVGKILEVEGIKGSKKLYKLVVDIGDEKRQIVAGIAAQYKKDELLGKTIVLVVNLEPAKIMGTESNGMLLAASKGKKLSLITVDREIAPGSRIR